MVGLCCRPQNESPEGDVPNGHPGYLSLLSGGCVRGSRGGRGIGRLLPQVLEGDGGEGPLREDDRGEEG